jgi:hypothetical protein
MSARQQFMPGGQSRPESRQFVPDLSNPIHTAPSKQQASSAPVPLNLSGVGKKKSAAQAGPKPTATTQENTTEADKTKLHTPVPSHPASPAIFGTNPNLNHDRDARASPAIAFRAPISMAFSKVQVPATSSLRAPTPSEMVSTKLLPAIDHVSVSNSNTSTPISASDSTIATTNITMTLENRDAAAATHRSVPPFSSNEAMTNLSGGPQRMLLENGVTLQATGTASRRTSMDNSKKPNSMSFLKRRAHPDPDGEPSETRNPASASLSFREDATVPLAKRMKTDNKVLHTERIGQPVPQSDIQHVGSLFSGSFSSR